MIAILGAGSWGTALATTVALNNPFNTISIYSRSLATRDEINNDHTNKKYTSNIELPENVKANDDLISLVKNNTYIIIAVPSHAFAELINNIKSELTIDHKVLSATKGLDNKTGDFLSNVFYSHIGSDINFSILSGPSFSDEVMNNLPTAVNIISTELASLELWYKLFNSKFFRIYKSQDIMGAQVAGTFKNILAVAAGISDGLNLGSNARAALISRGIFELSKLIEVLGFSANTVLDLAGIGDIVLTCSDNKSRNKKFGELLGTGKNISEAKQEVGKTIEALTNAKALLLLAQKHNIELPITEQVNSVLEGTVIPIEAVDNLLNRQKNIN